MLPLYTFVTFYTALSPETRLRLGRITNSFRVPEQADCWIDLMFRSARYFHPGCRCVLLSDVVTPLSPPPYVEVCRRPITENDPLWSRWQAESAFLCQADPQSNIVFLDFDVLVNASLDSVFSQPFDIALTYRRYLEMPINAGVTLVRAGGHHGALRFFDRFLSIFDQCFRQEPWYGEQYALAEAVGTPAFEDPPPDSVTVDGIDIRMLPCALYNYSPSGSTELLRLSPQIALIHFKGKRKTLLRQYWQAHYLRREQPHQVRSYVLALAARLSLMASTVTGSYREED